MILQFYELECDHGCCMQVEGDEENLDLMGVVEHNVERADGTAA